jgi:CRP-like cAMP-binding protein
VVTSLQRLLGNEVLGRAFGAIDGLIVGAILAGMLIAPIAVRLTSIEGGLAIAGLITFASAAIFVPKARAIDRAASARAEALAPYVEVLERLGIFEGASRATLEGLAEVAMPVMVPAAGVVLRQGDAPDDLYAVVRGALDASVRDGDGLRVVGSLGAGDYFGEIGLLRNVPRTATVTAVTACDLLRIPGDRFLSIVTGEASRISTLSRTAQARLTAQRDAVRPADAARKDD